MSIKRIKQPYLGFIHVFSRIIISLSLFLLAGCSTLGDYWHSDYTDANYNTASRANNATPKQIALLLPLSGPMGGPGRAVRDGFMASYYQEAQSGQIATKVRVYDTMSGDIEHLYEKAILDGADCVVGPLEKDKVQRLVRSPAPITTLVLNYTDAQSLQSPNLYQFGLSPLDEATQVAQYAASADRHSALIIAPAGVWGNGVVQAFQNEWQKSGGKTLAQYRYIPSQDMGPYIRQLLQVNDSPDYDKHMAELLGRSLRPEEHRRQDADMIFLVALPPKARQINPLLKFYYAGDLPVYSIASVYSGIPAPLYDQDLDGIVFDDMPWVFNPEAARLSSFPKLYALGMDAFMVIMKRGQWQNSSNLTMQGKTGVLYLQSGHQISRKRLIWAQFQQGEARPL